MELKRLEDEFTVCKIKDVSQVDFNSEFVFLSKTDEELSLVCPTAAVPADVIIAEDGWRALKITGVLDFGMIGVIAGISGLLAEARISLFVVSTYNTDYILLKSEYFQQGTELLQKNGYNII